ncbi:MAG: hypothetical protein ACKVPX_08740 [Myxococcaceae bacterium]
MKLVTPPHSNHGSPPANEPKASSDAAGTAVVSAQVGHEASVPSGPDASAMRNLGASLLGKLGIKDPIAFHQMGTGPQELAIRRALQGLKWNRVALETVVQMARGLARAVVEESNRQAAAPKTRDGSGSPK